MNVKYIDILKNNTSDINRKWYSAVIATYPETSGRFLFDNTKQFSNPIGYNIAQELPLILEELIEPSNPEKLYTSLENIIKIRAVQDFSASEALAFVFHLKKIIRSEFLHIKHEDRNIMELLEFESRIDQAASIAFDIFMAVREKLYEIKSNEVKKSFGNVIDRLNRKYEHET